MDELAELILLDCQRVFGVALTRGLMLFIIAINLYCILDLSFFLLKQVYWWIRRI